MAEAAADGADGPAVFAVAEADVDGRVSAGAEGVGGGGGGGGGGEERAEAISWRKSSAQGWEA